MNLHIDNDTCHEIIFTQGGVSHSLDKLYYNEHLVWEKQSQHDYSQDYFTIESLEDNNSITLVANGTPPSITLYYSTDDGTTWSSYASATSKQWVLNTGDKLLLKGTNSRYYTNSTDYWSLTGAKTHNVYGNTMSLFYGDNFSGQTSLASSQTLDSFFENNAKLVDASNLVLPATTLVDFCYYAMFWGCTLLTSAPTLPATTLAQNCYNNMFHGCTSLTTPPSILPAATLATGCYYMMFGECTSLTTAPDLPATTLATGCYTSMFYGCIALTTAPELPATTLADNCYYSMFQDCTGLTTAPDLPAKTLTQYCYAGMFYGCTSLKKIVCLATNISASNCTDSWVGNVSATGDFYKDASMSSWGTGTSGIPSGWTVNNYVA